MALTLNAERVVDEFIDRYLDAEAKYFQAKARTHQRLKAGVELGTWIKALELITGYDINSPELMRMIQVKKQIRIATGSTNRTK